MKRKIFPAIPEVFSLQPNSDYSRFVIPGGATQMMRSTWISIGRRLDNAIAKVGRDVEKKQAA